MLGTLAKSWCLERAFVRFEVYRSCVVKQTLISTVILKLINKFIKKIQRKLMFNECLEIG